MKITQDQLAQLPEEMQSQVIEHGTIAPGAGGHMAFEVPIEKLEHHGIKGLGDLVALFAKPIAGVIDAVAGTDLKNCGGCAGRQETLNEVLPFR